MFRHISEFIRNIEESILMDIEDNQTDSCGVDHKNESPPPEEPENES